MFVVIGKNPDALAEIASLLLRPRKGRHESTLNSLHKKKIGKEMWMNVHIGDYDVDSVILDLGSYVNISTKKTWENIRKPQLVWYFVQLRLDNQDRVLLIG